MSMKNITLIGMPGVGKSTVGVILAKVLGYEFVDSDLLIQKSENMLLREIIARDGQDGFLKIENRVNASIETEKSVIATGGSVVYCAEAMEHLKEIGKVVYLKLEYGELKKRLGNLRGRGIIDSKDLGNCGETGKYGFLFTNSYICYNIMDKP